MKIVFFDWETFSEVDLGDVGLDNYSRHPSTGCHMLAWAINDGKIRLWIPKNPRSLDGMPAELLEAICDPENLLIAHNAQFERVIFQNVMGFKIPIPRFRDTMVCARSFSLPGKLDSVCEILKLSKKDAKADGEKLIKFFCEPDPKRKKVEETLFGPVGRFREPERFPDEWKQFCEYCIQDVHCERYLWKLFQMSPLTDDEWQNWFMDQEMNELGMPINRQMAENGLWLAQESKRRLKAKLVGITGLENPLSDEQMKEWLSTRGYEWGTLLADYVKMELANPNSKLIPEAREALKIRQEANKRSYTKLETLLTLLGPDNRLRYQFQFGAAGRTGRWAGSGFQPQNMPRPIKQVKKNPQRIVDLIMVKDYETIEKEYPSVIGAVASAIRMTIQAPEGETVAISDLNAIENRGVGYLARCPPILEVFEMGRCPYLSFATYLNPGMTYEELEAEYKLFEETKGEKGDDQKRQQAKAPVLGGGYGLGIGELFISEFGDEIWGGVMGYARRVCGYEMPLEVAQKAIPALRKAWPEVVQYWKDLEEGFKHVFKTGKSIRIGEVTYKKHFGKWQWVPCETVVKGAVLEIDRQKLKNGGYVVRIKLPSGRYLHYLNVQLVEETVTGKDGKPWVREQIQYEGIEHSATTGADGAREKKRLAWGMVKTYGGKICENVVQAFCRDLLVYAMRLARDLGFKIFGCFHDEIAALIKKIWGGLSIHDLKWCMRQSPPWAPDMPLGADGFQSPFYRKG